MKPIAPNLVLVAISLIVMAFGPASVVASDRSVGDSWTYDVEFSVSGVPVSGTLVYAYVGDDSIAVNGTSHNVSEMRVSGAFSGSAVESSVNVSVTGIFDGYGYEARDGQGIVGTEVFVIVNVSTGYGDFRIASSYVEGESVLFDAPLMSAFDPDSPEQITTWNQTTDVFSVYSYEDESIEYESESSAAVVFNITAQLLDEPIETAAGTFDGYVLTVVDDTGYMVMWYSEEAGNFVRVEIFDSTVDEPAFVAELSDYHYRDDNGSSAVVLAAAGIMLATAVLITVLVMAFRRRARGTATEAREASDAGQTEPYVTSGDETLKVDRSDDVD